MLDQHNGLKTTVQQRPVPTLSLRKNKEFLITIPQPLFWQNPFYFMYRIAASFPSTTTAMFPPSCAVEHSKQLTSNFLREERKQVFMI